MNLEKFAADVHQNAIDHGFWEKVDPAAMMALIHAEWSEALEEYRAEGRESCGTKEEYYENSRRL